MCVFSVRIAFETIRNENPVLLMEYQQQQKKNKINVYKIDISTLLLLSVLVVGSLI